MKRALVTGITGQDGAYIAQLLLGKGYEVFATNRRTGTRNFWRINELGIADHPGLHLTVYNLTDPGNTIRMLEKAESDEVYNLAAQSFVGSSFEQPETTGQITGLEPLRLLEGIRVVNPKIRYYQASTSEMFGKVQAVPQVEMAAKHAGMDIEWQGHGLEEKGINKKTGKAIIRITPQSYRLAEVDLLIGDPPKARVELDWEAATGLDELCAMMVESDFRRNQ